MGKDLSGLKKKKKKTQLPPPLALRATKKENCDPSRGVFDEGGEPGGRGEIGTERSMKRPEYNGLSLASDNSVDVDVVDVDDDDDDDEEVSETFPSLILPPPPPLLLLLPLVASILNPPTESVRPGITREPGVGTWVRGWDILCISVYAL